MEIYHGLNYKGIILVGNELLFEGVYSLFAIVIPR